MRFTCLAAACFAAIVASAAAGPNGPENEVARPAFDPQKMAEVARILAEPSPLRYDVPRATVPITEVLPFFEGIYDDIRFRVEVDRRVLGGREMTWVRQDAPRSVGHALEDALGQCGCELSLLPDGTLLVREKPRTVRWMLDRS